MFVVALIALAGALEVEAASVASILGLTAYDVKARLIGGLPRVVFQSSAREEACRVHEALLARGHSAAVSDTQEVIPSAQMMKLRRFSIDGHGLWAHDHAGEKLAWDDLGAVVVAAIRTNVLRTTRERTLVQGEDGPVEHDHPTNEHVLTHAAYLFPHARATERRPWLLEEQTAQYVSLGPKMLPTRHQNFFATIDLVRDHAPRAVFDDRFVEHPLSSAALVQVRGSESATPSTFGANLDLTVQVLAQWMMRDRGGPYRG